MDYNRKIFISNIITFAVLLISFLVIHSYLQEINFESQYRHYIKYGEDWEESPKINISNITNINNSNPVCKNQQPTEEFKLGYDLIIPVAVSLILLLNTLYYIVQKIYENYNNNKPTI